MSCTVCNHRWCWVCGANLDSKLHRKFVGVCQTFNTFALHEKIPTWLKPVVAILALILAPILFLFITPIV